MTTEPSNPCRYIDGPLNGQEADSARPFCRDPDGVAMPAGFGDRRLMHGRWQPGETGIYSRTERGYEWTEAPQHPDVTYDLSDRPAASLPPDPPRDMSDVWEEVEAELARIAGTTHYRVRQGKILRNAKTGEPLTEKGTSQRARQALARLQKLRNAP